jgi:adenine/guanine/hypoxanthine permease
MGLSGAFQLGLLTMVLTLLLVTLLETAGTLIGVTRRAGLLDAEGRLARLRQALLAGSGFLPTATSEVETGGHPPEEHA